MRFFKLLKIFTAGFLISAFLFSLNIYIRQSRINKDNPNYKMSFDYLDKANIKLEKDSLTVIFVGNSRCPGAESSIVELNNNLKIFKQKGIPYYLLFDEVFKESEDKNLKTMLQRNQIGEKVFLINPENYPNKQGIYNSWRRFHSFIKDFDPDFEKKNLSYPHYFILKNGKIVDHSNSFNPDMMSKQDKHL
jgi:hypothetical protein